MKDAMEFNSGGPALCHKKPIRDKRVARTKAARIQAATGTPTYIYKCPGCKLWHVTRKPTI